MTRYAKRVDENQADVVAEIRAALPEATVFDLSGSGKGIPDLLIGFNGGNYLVEIKDGSKPPSERKLTPAQEALHTNWQGQVAVANNSAEAIAAILRAVIRKGGKP